MLFLGSGQEDPLGTLWNVSDSAYGWYDRGDDYGGFNTVWIKMCLLIPCKLPLGSLFKLHANQFLKLQKINRHFLIHTVSLGHIEMCGVYDLQLSWIGWWYLNFEADLCSHDERVRRMIKKCFWLYLTWIHTVRVHDVWLRCKFNYDHENTAFIGGWQSIHWIATEMSDLQLPSEKVLEFKCDVQHGQKYVIFGFVTMILAYYVLREVLAVRVKRGSWTMRKASMMGQLVFSFIIGIFTMITMQFLYRYLWKEEALVCVSIFYISSILLT